MSSVRPILSLSGLLVAGLLVPGILRAGATASSFAQIPGQPASQYSPLNVVDGDPKTVWMEGAEGPGDGSWLKIDLPRGTIQKLRLSGGHLQDERMYQKYSRAKDITLEFFTMDDNRILQPVKKMEMSLPDKFGFQEVAVENINIGGELFGGELRITVKSTWPGKDFRDMVISEVQMVLEEYPAQCSVESVSSTRAKAPPPTDPKTKKQDEVKYKEGTDVDVAVKVDVAAADIILDGNPRTSWITAAEGAGQFVVLEVPDYGMAAAVITPPNEPGVARPKQITIEVGTARFQHILKDEATPQRVDFPYTNGYNGGHFGRFKVTIDSVYGADPRAPSGISEVRIFATNYSV